MFVCLRWPHAAGITNKHQEMHNNLLFLAAASFQASVNINMWHCSDMSWLLHQGDVYMHLKAGNTTTCSRLPVCILHTQLYGRGLCGTWWPPAVDGIILHPSLVVIYSIKCVCVCVSPTRPQQTHWPHNTWSGFPIWQCSFLQRQKVEGRWKHGRAKQQTNKRRTKIRH